jgi:metallo-beta-lactamase class B
MEISNPAAAVRIWEETERSLHDRGAGYIRNPSSMHLAPFRIFGNLYYVGDRVVCVHLLATEAGLILFDSGYPHATGQLLGNISALGFSPSDIKYIVHSHEHFDHFGATRFFQEHHGARTFLHAEGARTFRYHPHHTEIQSSDCPHASLFLPDVKLKDGDTVRLGETEISIVHTPGHSAGAVSCFFRLEEKGQTVRAGLCGVNGNIPLHPGRLLKYGIPLTSGDEYLASIGKLSDFEVDLTLDTHPRPQGIIDRHVSGQGSFLDPELWNRNLNDYRSRYHEMIDRFASQLRREEQEGGPGRDGSRNGGQP